MAEKNLVTFFESMDWKLDSVDICLDWNTPNGEFIADEYNIEPFTEPLKIFYAYKDDGKQLIDFTNKEGKVFHNFSPDSFRPKHSEINHAYRTYLRSTSE